MENCLYPNCNITILDYELNGFTVDEVMCGISDLLENKLLKWLELCPESFFK